MTWWIFLVTVNIHCAPLVIYSTYLSPESEDRSSADLPLFWCYRTASPWSSNYVYLGIWSIHFHYKSQEIAPRDKTINPRPAGPSPDPTLCWGGGRIGPPHLSRKPTDVGEKFKRKWKGLDEIFQIKFKNLTSRSPVTSQVRSNRKCLTFPFNAFPRQNAGNKRISSRWIDMIRVCDISEHRP